MPHAAPGPSRRTVLQLAGLALLGLATGCRRSAGRGATEPPASGAASGGSPSTSASPRASATSRTDQVVARVAAGEIALLAAYDSAIAAHPTLAPSLMPLREEHAQHLLAVQPSARTAAAAPSQSAPAPTASSSAAPSSTAAIAPASAAAATPPTGSAPAGSGAPTPSPSAVIQRLVALESTAAADRLADLSATPPNLARLVASIGGCEAGHAALLRAIA